MNISRADVEALIDLYQQCNSEFNDGDSVQLGDEAVSHYASDPNRAKFCSTVNNLHPDSRAELLALHRLGQEKDATSSNFNKIFNHAKTTTDETDGEHLFGKGNLVETWRRAMDIMKM